MWNLTSDWQTFFSAEVDASAALTGLVVVAISVNLSRILSVALLPGRAAEALIVLAGALVLASVALVPRQPLAVLGAEVLAIGAATFVGAAVIQQRAWRMAGMRAEFKPFTRLLINLGVSLPILIAGALLILGHEAGLYWAAAGVILSLVAGVLSAWVLLIEILR